MPPNRTSSARASHGRSSLSPVPTGLRSGVSPTPHQPTSSPRTIVDKEERSRSLARPSMPSHANSLAAPPPAAVVVPVAVVAPPPRLIGDMEDVADGNIQKGPHKWVDKPKLSEAEIQLRKQAHQQALDALVAEGKTTAEAKKIVQQRERAARRVGVTLMTHVAAPSAAAAADAQATMTPPVSGEVVSKQLLEELTSMGNNTALNRANAVKKESPKNLFTFNSSALLGESSMEALDSCTVDEISKRLRCPSQPTYGEHFHHSAFVDNPKTPTSKILQFFAVYCGAVTAVMVAVAVAAYSLREGI